MRFSVDRRRLLLLVLVFAVVGLGALGGAWYYVTQYVPAQRSAAEQGIQTTRVRRGDLLIAVTGSGTLMAADEVDLSFGGSGVVSEVLVDVGDWVESGDVLARIDPAPLERALMEAEADLLVAQDDLENVENPYNQLDLNQAYLAVNQAASDVEDAKENLAVTMEPSGCMYSSVVDLEYEYSWYEENYYREADEYEAGDSSREELDAASDNLQWATERLEEALACPPGPDDVDVCADDYAWYQDRYAEMGDRYRAGEMSQEQLFAFWDRLEVAKQRLEDARQAASEVENAQDQVADCECNLQQAREDLSEMLSGPDAADLQVAQAKLLSAEAALEEARAALEGAAIVAPFSGVITSVQARVGETVGTDSAITLADMTYPLIEIYLDETDVSSVEEGYEVEVIFDALPDDVFVGHVVLVEPALTSVQNAPTVMVYARLDEEWGEAAPLPMGANAMVDVIAARAGDVLLVSTEALYELSPGEYAVMLMVDGEPQMRQVEVGVMDYAYAEIISGLEQGDVVSTGLVPTTE
jgi:RND family efflux transporter MFP subunit